MMVNVFNFYSRSTLKRLCLYVMCLSLCIALLFMIPSFFTSSPLNHMVGWCGHLLAKPYHMLCHTLTYLQHITTTHHELDVLEQKAVRLEQLEVQHQQLHHAYETLSQQLKYVTSVTPQAHITTDVFMGGEFGGISVFWVHAGAQQGLQNHQAAVANGTLMGRLIDVGEAYSKILPVDHPLSQIPVFLGSQEERALACGMGKGRVALRHIPQVKNVAPGDLVITSGEGGLLPKGMIIGTLFFSKEGWPCVSWRYNLPPPRYVQIIKCA